MLGQMAAAFLSFVKRYIELLLCLANEVEETCSARGMVLSKRRCLIEQQENILTSMEPVPDLPG
jgi:hypothetical protein